jgi:hypothetical protein
VNTDVATRIAETGQGAGAESANEEFVETAVVSTLQRGITGAEVRAVAGGDIETVTQDNHNMHAQQ